MDSQVEDVRCKRRRYSTDSIDNDFYEKYQTMVYIEEQLESLLIAVKRMKQSIERNNNVKSKKVREKVNIIKKLINIRSKINDDIDKDIENINKLKSVNAIKESLIENLNNVRESKNKDIDEEIFYVKSLKNDNLKIPENRSRLNSYEENIKKISGVRKRIKKYVNSIGFTNSKRKRIYVDDEERLKQRTDSQDSSEVEPEGKVLKSLAVANAIIEMYQNAKEI